ncbi:hypothetical protein HDU84_001057 [Entophlyctis sp. JEL0112]|nr:hypothetical protein HDU84_001057 [Entophlyctis sp. JEL0112]
MPSNSVSPAPLAAGSKQQSSSTTDLPALPGGQADSHPAETETAQSTHTDVSNALGARHSHTSASDNLPAAADAASAGPPAVHGPAAHVDANASAFSLSANMGAQWEAEGVPVPPVAHESSPRSTHVSRFNDETHPQAEEMQSPLSGPSTQAGDPLTPTPDNPLPEQPKVEEEEKEEEEDQVPEVMRKLHFQLIPFAAQGQHPNPTVECVERKIREGEVVRIGRKVVKSGNEHTPEGQDDSPLNVWYSSKVVSRNHAELWIADGQLFVKDIGSSSGTFLNKLRLSPSGKVSEPYAVRENDLLVFGVDYKGKAQDDLYKAVSIRIGFYDNTWIRQLRKKADTKKYSFH